MLKKILGILGILLDIMLVIGVFVDSKPKVASCYLIYARSK